MNSESKLKWFGFSQNNSGGYFEENENVCEYVIIQAHNAQEAISIGEQFMDNSGSCPCCGDRWSFYVDDSDGTDSPSIYGEPIDKMTKSWAIEKAILHYYDRTKKVYVFGASHE